MVTTTGIEVRRVTVTGFVTKSDFGSIDKSFTLIYDGTAAVRVKSKLVYSNQLDERNVGQLLVVLGRVHMDKEGVYLIPELVRRLRNKDFPNYIQNVPCLESQTFDLC